MIFKKDKTLGYMYSYEPSHPLANKSGKVYEHHYVMCSSIGRKLKVDECVHHIDRDKTNNSLDNLMLLTFEEHRKLHAVEDDNFKTVEVTCSQCKRLFTLSEKEANKRLSKSSYGGICCSEQCDKLRRKKLDVNKEELEKLVWNHPTLVIAKMLNVSDVAVAKRCKKLNIRKPPRGFWAKIQNNKFEGQTCPLPNTDS